MFIMAFACILDRMEPQSSSSSGVHESVGNREDKLRHRRERERARRASEGVEQREERLRTRRTRDRTRCTAQTAEDRAAGLKQRIHRRAIH